MTQKEYLEIQKSLLSLTDEELISRIIDDSNHISILYEKHHKDFCRKLKNKNKDINIQSIEDIVTDSIIDLLEKILKLGTDLLRNDTDSLKKYLSGICKNKILNERKRTEKINPETELEIIGDFSDSNEDFANPKIILWKKSLEILKEQGGKCYSMIILSSKAFYKYTIADLTELFNYANEATTRTQKYNCVQRLKTIYSELQLL